ncbi:uncharacterized protein LOC113290897 [Papaver somniferum]|uniref:uncharacterized protein LOC113290897 n=1 Tax=Papaver somniferum TaxID=3469 RepID=UPI000E6FD581|nr:uncharacterized protein LOC113290897 [Papaver somniferum]
MRSLADKAKMQVYYWPQMIRDASRMYRRCEECQHFAKRIHSPATKLNSVDSPCPFSKWGVDIVGTLIEGSGSAFLQKLSPTMAYRTTRRSVTGESPFLLTYGTEAVIPTEIIMSTTKTEAWEKNLTTDMMLERLDDLEERREAALQRMENYQRRLAREYNKKVKLRNFVEGQHVLRTIPQYQRERKWGKLAPTWGGPYT